VSKTTSFCWIAPAFCVVLAVVLNGRRSCASPGGAADKPNSWGFDYRESRYDCKLARFLSYQFRDGAGDEIPPDPPNIRAGAPLRITGGTRTQRTCGRFLDDAVKGKAAPVELTKIGDFLRELHGPERPALDAAGTNPSIRNWRELPESRNLMDSASGGAAAAQQRLARSFRFSSNQDCQDSTRSDSESQFQAGLGLPRARITT